MEHFNNIEDILSYYQASFRSFYPFWGLKNFDCNNTQRTSYNKHNLNDFLIKYGESYNKFRTLRITILENKADIIAYYSLLHDSLHISMEDELFAMRIKELIRNEPVDFQKNFQSQIEFPAIKIGHLAVNKDYQAKGIGTCLIKTIIGQIINNTNWYGCQYLTVDSLMNSDTNKFYSKNSFLNAEIPKPNSTTVKKYLPLFDYF